MDSPYQMFRNSEWPIAMRKSDTQRASQVAMFAPKFGAPLLLQPSPNSNDASRNSRDSRTKCPYQPSMQNDQGTAKDMLRNWILCCEEGKKKLKLGCTTQKEGVFVTGEKHKTSPRLCPSFPFLSFSTIETAQFLIETP